MVESSLEIAKFLKRANTDNEPETYKFRCCVETKQLTRGKLGLRTLPECSSCFLYFNKGSEPPCLWHLGRMVLLWRLPCVS